MKENGGPALTPRLKACAELAEAGEKLIDVGTDHAYLPISLLLAGKVPAPVWATDVNEGPLERARRSAEEYGAAEKLCFVRTDGLSGLDPALAHTVVIAGMGGETIAAILAAADPGWRKGHRFILQPMTKAPVLCRALWELDLCVTRDRLVREGRTVYRVLAAEEGTALLLSPLAMELGPTRGGDPVYLGALEGLIHRLEKARAGLITARNGPADRLRETEALLDEARQAWEKLNKQ